MTAVMARTLALALGLEPEHSRNIHTRARYPAAFLSARPALHLLRVCNGHIAVALSFLPLPGAEKRLQGRSNLR